MPFWRGWTSTSPLQCKRAYWTTPKRVGVSDGNASFASRTKGGSCFRINLKQANCLSYSHVLTETLDYACLITQEVSCLDPLLYLVSPQATRMFAAMSTSSLFSVNGVSATAQLNPSQQTTTISSSFATLMGLSNGDAAVISAPVTDQILTSSVVIRIADHMYDVAVGIDWLRLSAERRPIDLCACGSQNLSSDL